MGNNIQPSTLPSFLLNFTLLKYNSRNQPIFICQDANQYVLNTWTFAQIQDADALKESLKFRINSNKLHLTKVKNVWSQTYSRLCSFYYKIYALVEYPQYTLEDQYKQRKNLGTFLTEQQFKSILFSIAEGMKTIRERDKCDRYTFQLKDFGIDIKGVIKIFDPILISREDHRQQYDAMNISYNYENQIANLIKKLYSLSNKSYSNLFESILINIFENKFKIQKINDFLVEQYQKVTSNNLENSHYKFEYNNLQNRSHGDVQIQDKYKKEDKIEQQSKCKQLKRQGKSYVISINGKQFKKTLQNKHQQFCHFEDKENINTLNYKPNKSTTKRLLNSNHSYQHSQTPPFIRLSNFNTINELNIPQSYQTSLTSSFKEINLHNQRIYYGDKCYYQGQRNGAGQRQGYGILHFEDGGWYEGNWMSDQMNGNGRLYDEKGNLGYEGEFKKNEFSGKGKMLNPYSKLNEEMKIDNYKNLIELGDRCVSFSGFFHKDKMEGEGIMFLCDGSTIKGFWKNNLINGPAILTDKLGFQQLLLYQNGIVQTNFNL